MNAHLCEINDHNDISGERKLGIVAHTCNPSTQEAEIRRITVQDQPWKKS
jgi:hypothetical protein